MAAAVAETIQQIKVAHRPIYITY